ncbi:unnamed protein product [Parajaminaea phylloscopi]
MTHNGVPVSISSDDQLLDPWLWATVETPFGQFAFPLTKRELRGSSAKLQAGSKALLCMAKTSTKLKGASDVVARLLEHKSLQLSTSAGAVSLTEPYNFRFLPPLLHQLCELLVACREADQPAPTDQLAPAHQPAATGQSAQYPPSHKPTGIERIDQWYAALARPSGAWCKLTQENKGSILLTKAEGLDNAGDPIRHIFLVTGLSIPPCGTRKTWTGRVRYDASSDCFWYQLEDQIGAAVSELPLNEWQQVARTEGASLTDSVRQGLRKFLGLRTTAASDGRIQCESCFKIFTNGAGLLEHKRREHGEGSLQCYFCTETFATYFARGQHREHRHPTQAQERKEQRDESHAAPLEKDVAKKTPGHTFPCPHCALVCKERKHLNTHLRSKHEHLVQRRGPLPDVQQRLC